MILQDAMDSLEEGILITDEKQEVVYMNLAYGRLFHLSADSKKKMREHLDFLNSRFPSGQDEAEAEEARDCVSIVYQEHEFFYQLHKRLLYENGETYVYYRLSDRSQLEKLKKQQRQVIEEMTVNVLKISSGCALLHLPPLYSEDLQITLLERVPRVCQEKQVMKLALYLSSVTEMDPGWPILLEKLTMTLRLIGVEVALVGLRPSFVIQVTKAGIRIEHVRTFLDLEQAASYFLKR
ncbi:PAS domain-containing protein [Halobacillus sp. BBL2006]|uniref:PAS domain-containing protein n=1 Tax=Halobacillus sp. BBL2006 TaxID=1543706 RepID=UPI000543FD5D|nr:PAS domain-containing protein [Halobacillus sp. BBL2006]KHE67100.1 hypothetical protein LD39_19290 [Halobacillus sp. BBL2006]